MAGKRLQAGLLLVALLCMTMFGYADAENAWEARTTLHAGYAEQPLTQVQIEAILSAGFSMPTGGDQRALDFYVVTQREIMQGMKGGNPYAQALDSAPCVIVVAGDLDKALYDELLEMDAGIAAGAMLLEAADLGLTSCVLSIAPQEARIESVRESLAMPGNLRPILMIALGYPGGDGISSSSVRRPKNEQIHLSEKKEEDGMILEIDGRVFAATLEESTTAAAFTSLLPMDLQMTELNGNEKYHYLMGPLPSYPEQVGLIETGDILLFGDDCVVVFYETFSTPYAYTRIGKIEDTEGLKEALGQGDVKVHFAK